MSLMRLLASTFLTDPASLSLPLALAYQFLPGYRVNSRYVSLFSLRFRSGNSAYASLTPAAGTQDKWKLRWAFKPGLLSGVQTFISAGASSPDAIYLDANRKLCWDFAGTTRLVSTEVFRDPTCLTSTEAIYDAANATAALRARVFVSEGGRALREITAWDTDTRSSITTGTSKINTNVVHNIGRNSAGANNHWDGLLDDFALIDNSATSGFSGATNATTGRWDAAAAPSPKWWLKFDTVTSTTTLGNDSGSDGVAWTMSGFSLTAGSNYDALFDTPTNYADGSDHGNCCTLNPLASNTTYPPTDGNLTQYYQSSSSIHSSGTIAIDAAGDWQFEVTLTSVAAASAFDIGIGRTPGTITGTYHYYSNSGTKSTDNYIGETAYGATYGVNDVVGVVLSGGALTFYKNGVSQGVAYTGLTGLFFPIAFRGGGGDHTASFNFGQRPFAYPVSGKKGICTQNLPTPAIPKSSTEFASVIATESNIDATLAAARSGWSAYVDVLKNRSNSETWAWRFSHDSGQEYAVSTTATRQATRTNSGADNWVGYSFKIDGVAGMRAGSISHTNGADTTVTHNAGNARCMIFLFPRAGGEVPVYHPDCTAGKLLNLSGNDAETTSSTIKTITSNSFKIDTGTSTGTYDYLVLPEVAGFLKLGLSTGNGSADGTFGNLGLMPRFMPFKSISASSIESWYVHDSIRDPFNAAGMWLLANTADAESDARPRLDFLSSGYKLRVGSGGGPNVSGIPYAYVAIGDPFKYSAGGV